MNRNGRKHGGTSLGDGGFLVSSSVVEDERAPTVELVSHVRDVGGGDDPLGRELDPFAAVQPELRG